MMSEEPPVERRAAANLERHIQTIMIALIVGGLTFAASYFYSDNREKGESRAQIQILTTQVIELRADVKAMQSGFARRDEFDKLESRVVELDARIRSLERVR